MQNDVGLAVSCPEAVCHDQRCAAQVYSTGWSVRAFNRNGQRRRHEDDQSNHHLLQQSCIPQTDRPSANDSGEDADVSLVLFHNRSQDIRVFGQVPLRQRGHDATRAGLGDLKTHFVTDRERAANPVVFDEAASPVGRLDDDVRPKARDIKAALFPLRVQLIEGRRRDHVHKGAVKEGAGRQLDLKNRVGTGQPFVVGPVALDPRASGTDDASRTGRPSAAERRSSTSA